MTTVSAGMRWKMRKAGAFCALDTASKFAPRPLIVMFLVITSSAVVSVTVCPLSAASKLIMSPLFASTSACRCPSSRKRDRAPFLQPFQNRHKFHRDRHDNLKSRVDRVFHRYRDQCRGNPAGLERASSGDQAESGSNFSAGCAPGRSVLVLVRDETFSF